MNNLGRRFEVEDADRLLFSSMDLSVSYRQRSAVFADPRGVAIALAPNLRRDRVGLVAKLRDPVRFREAILALHDIVISDLRYVAQDKSAYQAFLAEKRQREAALRHAASTGAQRQALESAGKAVSPEFEGRFKALRKEYWATRRSYDRYVARNDPALWRKMVPLDPVVTVADDVVLFECFSADESSYGCLSVGRDAFVSEEAVYTGTTNVDYSWALREHFQTLRSYRETRLQIDPLGVTATTESAGEHYEEKIDLPPAWLRGFMQLQATQTFPHRKVTLTPEAVYSVLAWLKRRRAKTSPRALRFEMEPGRPVTLVLEPWEVRIELPSTVHTGPRTESVRIWGRDRLAVLARTLPLAERIDVHLTGTGFPSFWVVRMGDMRLTLGLSGWTANDWTSASPIDQIAPPAEPTYELLADLAAVFKKSPASTFANLRQQTGAADAYVAAGLHRLSLMGQVIHDLPAGVYRWRTLLPVSMAMGELAPENPETVNARSIVARKQVRLAEQTRQPDGMRVLEGVAENRPVTLLLDRESMILRGKCTCSHHHRWGIRRGPCRHLQAMRLAAIGDSSPSTLQDWYKVWWGVGANP